MGMNFEQAYHAMNCGGRMRRLRSWKEDGMKKSELAARISALEAANTVLVCEVAELRQRIGNAALIPLQPHPPQIGSPQHPPGVWPYFAKDFTVTCSAKSDGWYD